MIAMYGLFMMAASSQKCKNPATIGFGYVVEALNRRQEYRFAPGEKPEVYCEKHRPSFGDSHPSLLIIVAAVVWICLVGFFLR